MANPRHLETDRIDCAENVEVDKTVVQGRDQGVRHRMGETHHVGIVPRRIDDDKIVTLLDRAYRLSKRSELLSFDFVEPHAAAACDTIMHRDFQFNPGAGGPFPAVLDIMAEALLA